MSNLQILLSTLATVHADAIHVDLLPLAAHPERPRDELTQDIAKAVRRHAERLGVQLPY